MSVQIDDVYDAMEEARRNGRDPARLTAPQDEIDALLGEENFISAEATEGDRDIVAQIGVLDVVATDRARSSERAGEIITSDGTEVPIDQ